MKNLNESFASNSIWNTTTPNQTSFSLPYYAIEAGHFYANEDYFVKRNHLDSFLLILCIDGTGRIHTKDSEYTIKPGDSAIIDCRKEHAYYSTSKTWEFMWLHFNGTGSENIYNMIYPEGPHEITLTTFDEFKASLSELIVSLHSQDTLSQLKRTHDIENLLISMYARSISALESDDFSKIDPQIKEAVSYLESNYSTLKDLDSLINHLHVSKSYFIRKFKRIVGIPPYQYLTNYRITMAKRLLATTSDSIESIAYKSGFEDAANFIGKFKAHVGMTPLTYRKEHLW